MLTSALFKEKENYSSLPDLKVFKVLNVKEEDRGILELVND